MKPRFIISQKITPIVNRYAVHEVNEAGEAGSLLTFVQQKRAALREKIMFYGEESRQNLQFTLQAEKTFDIHGRYFVKDADDSPIGSFKKDFKRSFLASTWHILDDSDTPRFKIEEHNKALALARRYLEFIPIIGDIVGLVLVFFRYQFDIVDVTSQAIVGRVEKTTLVRDKYIFKATDESYQEIDWRVWAAMAVALDALQSR